MKGVKRIPVSKSKFFIGEMMVCGVCHRQLQSDPKIESGWTVLELDGIPFYVCPMCWRIWLNTTRGGS